MKPSVPVFKNLIAPFQRTLLAKRLCPGCTAPLDKAPRSSFEPNQDMTICSCRRMYIYDKNADCFRRATFREADLFSKKA